MLETLDGAFEKEARGTVTVGLAVTGTRFEAASEVCRKGETDGRGDIVVDASFALAEEAGDSEPLRVELEEIADWVVGTKPDGGKFWDECEDELEVVSTDEVVVEASTGIIVIGPDWIVKLEADVGVDVLEKLKLLASLDFCQLQAGNKLEGRTYNLRMASRRTGPAKLNEANSRLLYIVSVSLILLKCIEVGDVRKWIQRSSS